MKSMRPGSRRAAVRISLDALPRQSFPGKVRRVAPYVSAVEKQARTVDIEATFDDPAAPGKLLVGYSADVEVILAVRENVIRIPSSALLEGGRVLVAAADGTLEERQVKTGLANWEFTEVLEGSDDRRTGGHLARTRRRQGRCRLLGRQQAGNGGSSRWAPLIELPVSSGSSSSVTARCTRCAASTSASLPGNTWP
jgi:multidrug efflux pump subunit AcrA (membrane-fusion protein)